VNWAIVREPTILTTALVYGVLELVSIKAGLFGIWLGILLMFSLWRYSYSVLRAVAQGRKRIPPPDIDSFNPVGDWGSLWHFVAFPGLIIATMPYQPVGMFVAVLAACLFPASAAIMGLNSNLVDAFAPSTLIGFARTLGRDYGLLVLGAVGIVLGAGLVSHVIVPRLGFLATVAGLIVVDWAILAIFGLIGSALRAHRLEFEIAGEVLPPEDRHRLERHEEWRKSLDIAYASIRSDLTSAGYRTLRELTDSAGDSVEVNYWLVENMLEWEDKRYGLEVAAKLMSRLIAADDTIGALDLYRRCRRFGANLGLAPADAEQLAGFAAALGHSGLADELSYNRRSSRSSQHRTKS
jgi:hypothetical protein